MSTRPRQQILTLIAIALTFASGAADVTSFTRLGGVFTSVMTGNIVLWGLAAARGSLTLASHTAVSIAGYIVGVAAGTNNALNALGGVFGIAILAAVFAARGSYASPAAFIAGFRPAEWVAAAVAAAGVPIAALAPSKSVQEEIR